MRTVIQRVSHASVTIDGCVYGSIQQGFLILLGIEPSDTEADADWLAKKAAGLRIFDDEEGVMNRDIVSIGGNALVVSQFTLMASYKKGSRASLRIFLSTPFRSHWKSGGNRCFWGRYESRTPK